MKKCIINGKVILLDCVIEANVYIENDVITEISSRYPQRCDDVIDAMGQYVSPGFIDTHTHGRAGSDAMYPTFEDLNTISKAQAKTGVTSFLPTTMTMPISDTQAALKNIATYQHQVEGSQILGVHMEGPFFNKVYKGAQPEECMILPHMDHYLQCTNGCDHIVKKISLAPELDGAYSLIESLVQQQVVVSLGHTNATYEQAKKAIEHGATCSTHTYNAMTPLTHRQPGVVGAVFDDSRVFAELILDGLHVSYPAARILLKAKGLERVILITDSMEAAGLDDGTYKIGNQPVYVSHGSARLSDGTLAGSILSLNTAVKHAYEHLHLPIYEAVRLASYNPARSLNLYHIGEIAVGKQADIIFFDDHFKVTMTMIKGNMVE